MSAAITVWLARHDYRGGDRTVTRLFETAALAECWRVDLARTGWDDEQVSEDTGAPMPVDGTTAADIYFGLMHERGREWFEVSSMVVEREEGA